MSEPGVQIDIRVDADAWQALSLDAAAVIESAARAALAAAAEVGAAELSVLLTDDPGIADLNRRWRGRNGPTNVLSFPADDAPVAGRPVMLGDVIVSHATLMREAAEAGIPIVDHLRHLIVHGVLHLLGYDHENDDDAEEMESLEIAILAEMGVPDPYQTADAKLERQPS